MSEPNIPGALSSCGLQELVGTETRLIGAKYDRGRSGRVPSRPPRSLNLERSMYAYDTRSSKDGGLFARPHLQGRSEDTCRIVENRMTAEPGSNIQSEIKTPMETPYRGRLKGCLPRFRGETGPGVPARISSGSGFCKNRGGVSC